MCLLKQMPTPCQLLSQVLLSVSIGSLLFQCNTMQSNAKYLLKVVTCLNMKALSHLLWALLMLQSSHFIWLWQIWILDVSWLLWPCFFRWPSLSGVHGCAAFINTREGRQASVEWSSFISYDKNLCRWPSDSNHWQFKAR